MKKIFVSLFALATIAAQAQSVNWGLDKSHTNVKFSVQHMVISETEGSFKMFDAQIVTKNNTDFENAQINFTVDAASINTNDEMRDGHLKSPDFFNVEKFAKISFVGTSFKKVSGNKYKLIGNLTIKDITKSITLDVVYNGTNKDPWGNTHAGFKVSGSIKRTDWALTWNKTLETGGLLVGEDVDLKINLELLQPK